MNNAEIKKSLNGVKIEKSIRINKSRLMLIVETYCFEQLCKIIEEHFQIKPYSDLLGDITGEQMFKDYKLDKYKISIGFGEWYPFAILSETINSNKLVEEIFEWLQTIEIPVECD
jgi:hypothetical protein